MPWARTRVLVFGVKRRFDERRPLPLLPLPLLSVARLQTFVAAVAGHLQTHCMGGLLESAVSPSLQCPPLCFILCVGYV